MPNYKEIYNHVYSNVKDYTVVPKELSVLKDNQVLSFLKDEKTQVLDIGCGSGHYLQLMTENNISCFGIDVSDVCCLKHLKEYDFKVIDIVDFAKTRKKKFNSAICVDFLEHISEEDLDNVLSSITKVSNNVLFGIANHSDVLAGIELHLIKKDSDWWVDILSKYFKNIKKYPAILNNKFFFIEGGNEKRVEIRKDTEDPSSLLGEKQEIIISKIPDDTIIYQTQS